MIEEKETTYGVRYTVNHSPKPLISLAEIDEMIRAHNAECEADAREFGEAFIPLTRERVVSAMALGNHGLRDGDAQDMVAAIISTIVEQMVAEVTIDPWPGLTRADVKRMMGRRKGPRGHTSLPEIAAGRCHLADVIPSGDELSLREKFYCAQYREWLETGAGKRAAA